MKGEPCYVALKPHRHETVKLNSLCYAGEPPSFDILDPRFALKCAACRMRDVNELRTYTYVGIPSKK